MFGAKLRVCFIYSPPWGSGSCVRFGGGHSRHARNDRFIIIICDDIGRELSDMRIRSPCEPQAYASFVQNALGCAHAHAVVCANLCEQVNVILARTEQYEWNKHGLRAIGKCSCIYCIV